MTIAEQLRAIADRLEAASAMRDAALEELGSIAGDGVMVLDFFAGIEHDADSAAVQVAADEHQSGGEVGDIPVSSPAAPLIEQAGPPGGVSAGSGPHEPGPPVPSDIPCPECGVPFSPRGLGVHRRHVHGHRAMAKDATTCPDCGEPIAQAKNLPRHRQQKHGGKRRADGDGAVLRNGRETFLCGRCGEPYPTREARDLHQATHQPIPVGPTIGERGRVGARGDA